MSNELIRSDQTVNGYYLGILNDWKETLNQFVHQAVISLKTHAPRPPGAVLAGLQHCVAS